MINTIINSIIWGGNGVLVPATNVYPQTYIPVDSETLVAGDVAVPGFIFTSDLTKKEVVLSGAWTNGINLNALLGELGNPYVFTNENGSTLIGTTSLAGSAFAGVGGTGVNYIKLTGKDKDTPFIVSAGSGQSGVLFNPQVAGAILRFNNVIAKDVGYAGFLFSSPSSGGSYWKKLILTFCGKDGLVTEGESHYFGHVSTDTRAENIVLVHCFGKDNGREGLQIKWADRTRAYNGTYRNVGQVADTAQQHGWQVEVSKDTQIIDNIFDGCKRPFNIFSHDIIIDGGFTRWTSTAGYIGKASTFWSGHPNLTGVKVIFKNHTFIFDNAGSGYLAQWEETGCDLEFQNCVFSDNINSSIVQDIRVGGTNNLIGTTTTNGNTVVAKATLLTLMPTYVSNTYNNKDFNNLSPATYWFNRGVGKGSPTDRTIQILDVEEAPTESVAYGTTYASLTNPSTVDCLLSNGTVEALPITWAQGSYDGNVAGTYTIYGTPTGYTNTDNVKCEKQIVVAAYVNPNTVRVNFASNSSTYVGSGNWNHLAQNFTSGVITVKGDNSGQTLASLRNVGGSLTGFQVNITTVFDSGDNGQVAGGAGAFPDAAIRSHWTTPGAPSRAFKITGLNTGTTYTLKFLGSAADYLSGSSHLIDITVAGGSGGGTLTNQETEANISNTINFTCVPNGSGEITVTLANNTTGVNYLNLLELSW